MFRLNCPNCDKKLPAYFAMSRRDQVRPCPSCATDLCIKAKDRGCAGPLLFMLNLLIVFVMICIGVPLMVGADLPAGLVSIAIAGVLVLFMLAQVALTNTVVINETPCLKCGHPMLAHENVPCAACGWYRTCPGCGYDLRGSAHARSDACPECGRAIAHQKWQPPKPPTEQPPSAQPPGQQPGAQQGDVQQSKQDPNQQEPR